MHGRIRIAFYKIRCRRKWWKRAVRREPKRMKKKNVQLTARNAATTMPNDEDVNEREREEADCTKDSNISSHRGLGNDMKIGNARPREWEREKENQTYKMLLFEYYYHLHNYIVAFAFEVDRNVKCRCGGSAVATSCSIVAKQLAGRLLASLA